MQKVKLFFLYGLLFLFILVGVFCAYQMFFIPEEPAEEEPYEFETLQETVVTPVPTVPKQDQPIEGQQPLYELNYDAEALKSENADFVAWLMIPDTSVSFPVVLGDDNQFYLKHGFSKAYSRYGCPFLDTRTPIEGESRVIHGHNMGNNRTEMFSPLVNYQNPDFASAHKTVLFSVPDSEDGDTYELFAVVNQNMTEDFDCFQSVFETEDVRSAFISHFKKHSLYETDFLPEGKILILSTCNNTYGTDNRLLICLGLV